METVTGIDMAGRAVLIGERRMPSAAAQRALEGLGVEVRVGKPVTACDAEGVVSGGERIEARSILWAAGVAASPAAQWPAASADRAGRVEVREDLSVSGHPKIFVVGDTCLSKSGDGKPVPGIVPAAKQMGAPVRRGRPVDFPRASRLIENDNRRRPRVRESVHRHASEEESHAGQE